MVVTVREFIELLKSFPPDTPMILSTDEEGNELRMVNGVGPRYVKELEHRFMEDINDEDEDWHGPEVFANRVYTAEVW